MSAESNAAHTQRTVARDREARELVRGALAGEPPAVRALVERLMPVVRGRIDRWLVRRGWRRIGGHERDDLAQEVWLVLVRDGGRALLAYDPARGASFEGYVGMLVERELGNLVDKELGTLKRRALASSEGGGDLDARSGPAISPESLVAEKQTGEHLAAYLGAHLPPKGRLVCRYLFEDGKSPDEVAQILGVTRQVVYNWQHRARRLTEAFFEEKTTG